MAHKLSLHRLPAPLTFYVRINALSESHLRQVAKLKRVYGPDLLRDLSRESVTAQGEMSVEDLSFLIEGWKDRFQNAVSWWVERGTNPPNALPRDRDEALLWRCFYSDLRHSGALDEQTNTISPMLKMSGARVVLGGHTSRGRLPSAVQAGIAKYILKSLTKTK